MEYNTEKKCKDKCPKCGSEEIEWEKIESDEYPYIEGFCLDCNCCFQEVYVYSITCYRKPE